MNEVEQESIILNSVWEMIDGMVNWAMFVKHERTDPTNMMFETSGHAQLFNILLGDFLSELRAFKRQPIPFGLPPAPANARPSDLTFLFYLRQVCANPRLGRDSSSLSTCVENFADWLEGETLADGVNLHDIDVVADIRVPRYRYLKICGDIAKHNIARLAGNVKHIRALLQASGHPVSEQDAYLAVPNFFEWFHQNIFIYHSSLIAEALNNIRWTIFDYLQAEFRRSWHSIELPIPVSSFQMYGYHYPEGCTEPVAKAMYWELMNRVRGRPWMHRFVISDSFKSRY
jgi:hypothetical protein